MLLIAPTEVTEQALAFSRVQDVASFSQTCRLAYRLVYSPNDQHLWRELFLRFPFDDLRKSLRTPGRHVEVEGFVDWRAELRRRVEAEKIAFSGGERPREKKKAVEAFIDTILDALPAAETGEGLSTNITWVSKVLRGSHLLETDFQPEEAAAAARLRSYLALSLNDGKDTVTHLRMKKRRVQSRCYVYDLGHYSSENQWGPYNSDGTVNWIHVEAIINVISMNLAELPRPWLFTRPPNHLEATRPYSAPELAGRNPLDWAGVEGIWRRYICFMDYRQLFAFNRGPRNSTFFEGEIFREAIRLIEIQLHLCTPAEMQMLKASPSSCTSEYASTQYPPLYFSGTSRGVGGHQAVVEGVVRMGSDGVVRWSYAYKTSIYDGHTMWSSEGVQVGNVGSAMGVVGIWTGALHEAEDPVGPFWLWKVDKDSPTQY